jgi:peptidylprolyl isomerase
MSKPNKSKKSSGSPETSPVTANKTLVLAIGVIIVLAVIAIAAFVVLSPGATVVNGDSVSVYYTGKFSNGSVFDSNVNKSPMIVTIGAQKVIKGFENALIGMKAGETKTVTIPVEMAYGPYRPDYVQTFNRSGTPLANMTLVPGKTLSYQTKTGEVGTVTILKVTQDTVTVDGNSPLAGQPLTFTIKLISINKDTGRNASSGI